MTDEPLSLDELMSLDPLEMTAANIDSIIAYHRKNRAETEAGVKPKKEKGPSPTISLSSLMEKIAAKRGTPEVVKVSPKGTGMRRI